MIDWTCKEVAEFFATTPQMPYEEDTEFRFQFQVREAQAELCVSPFNEMVTLTLWIGKKEEHLAYWAFDCTRIHIHEEDPEDDGPILGFESSYGSNPGQLQAWLAIGKCGDVYSIHAASVRTPVE